MDETREAETQDERRDEDYDHVVPHEARVRDEDLQPHEGLRYIARLFKFLAVLLLLLLVAEVIIGLVQEGRSALVTLMVEATRLFVFAGFLWGVGDIAVMLIESNHDLRATRILVGRLNTTVQQGAEAQAGSSGIPPAPGQPSGGPINPT